jgi:hypothetical protein
LETSVLTSSVGAPLDPKLFSTYLLKQPHPDFHHCAKTPTTEHDEADGGTRYIGGMEKERNPQPVSENKQLALGNTAHLVALGLAGFSTAGLNPEDRGGKERFARRGGKGNVE